MPSDTNDVPDIFVHDTATGTTTRVSVDSAGVQATAAGGQGGEPHLSADGRSVAFDSVATNLVPGDTNEVADIFVHDCNAATTTRVSVDSAGVEADASRSGEGSNRPRFSADGQWIAFDSGATNLVTADTNGAFDVFVHDLLAGTTTRISIDSNGAQATDSSTRPSLSADGRHVAFASDAADLVEADTNDVADIFVHDRVTGTTTRVSVDSGGGQVTGNAAGSGSSDANISADGRFVSFDSAALDLVLDDTNDVGDVFLRGPLSHR